LTELCDMRNRLCVKLTDMLSVVLESASRAELKR
jgi:hypothetical protein